MKALLILLLLGVAVVSAKQGGFDRDRSRGGGRKGNPSSDDEQLMQRCLGDEFMDITSAAREKCKMGAQFTPLPNWGDFVALAHRLQNLVEGDKPMYDQNKQTPLRPLDAMSEEKDDDFNLDLSVSFPSKTFLKLLSMIRENRRGNRRGMGHKGKWDSGEDMGPSRYDGMGGKSEEYGSRGQGRPKSYRGRGGYDGKYNDFTSEEYGGEGYRRMGGRPDWEDDRVISKIFDAFLTSAMGKKFRNKRQADIGNKMEVTREDLIARLKMLQKAAMTLTGNMTCFWQELNLLDADGNLNAPETIQEVIDSFEIKDKFVAETMKLVSGSCQKSAMALPMELHLLFQLDEKLARGLSFDTCMELSMEEVCKNQDVRKQLEESYGPISKLVEETGLDEGALLTLAGSMI